MLEIVSTIQGLLQATMIGTYLADIAFSSLRKHDELARCDMWEPYADAALAIMLRRAVKLSRDSLKLLHKTHLFQFTTVSCLAINWTEQHMRVLPGLTDA